MKMKKILAMILAGSLAAASLAGCAGDAGKSAAPASSAAASAAASQAEVGTDVPSDYAKSTAYDEISAKSKYKGTPDKDMVTVNLGAEPPKMNSVTTTDATAHDIIDETIAGLVRLDAKDAP